MKIVVIGGSGLIGSKLVGKLRQIGHEVVAASPKSGVNTLTGEGLAEALAGARGCRRRGELAVVRGRGRPEILRDLRAETCLPQRRPPASGITSRYRSSGPSGCSRVAIFPPSWRRRS